MNGSRLPCLVTVALLAAVPPLAFADAWGDPGLAFRYRFENVDDAAFEEEADASTLRLRLNFLTPEYSGFSAFVEVDTVFELGPDDYNAGAGNSPERVQFPVVADPDGTDLNQLWVQWAAGEGRRVRAGRQRIIYDNARFVGNVGWRQNEQTFDALAADWLLAGMRFQYAYVDNVNRIFGNDVPAGDQDNDTHLLNVSRALGEAGRLAGYGYEIDNRDDPLSSTRTWGLRWVGAPFGAFAYALEFARQSDAANNPVDYDADYWRLDASLGGEDFSAFAGWEVLGGDASRPGAAFRTPLATLHAFNGWADRFLVTPDAGLEDLFIGLKGRHWDWSWQAVLHDFTAEDGSADWGSELDVSAAHTFAERYELLLKFADFEGDSPGFPDTRKFWLQLSAAY